MTSVGSSVIHTDFGEFMRRVALPLHLANSGHARLDGQPTGGNWDVSGRFRWQGRVWKVHSDSHYEPLLLAYYSWQHLLGEETFVEATMQHAQRLDLAPSLSALRSQTHRYLYIYEEK